jgi:hypothetical protein
MPFVPVDINTIKLDAPQPVTGFVPVDINTIKLDEVAPPEPMSKTEEYVTRPLGQAARMTVGGIGSVLDTPRIVTDALSYGGYKAADLIGADKAKEFFRQQNVEPTFSQKFQGAFDSATDGAYKPANTLEKGVDVVGQVLTGVMAGKGAEKTASAIGDMVKTKQPIPSADDIKALANQAYKKADEVGGTLNKEVSNRFIAKIDEIQPQSALGKQLGGDSESSKVINKLKTAMQDRPITLQEANELDQWLGDSIDGFTTLGKVNNEGRKIMQVQDRFRKLVTSAGANEVTGGKAGFDALKEGRDLWSKQAKMRDIEKIIYRAEQMDNPATGIKTGFRTLFSNPSRMRGYSTEEKKLIEQAAKSGFVADSLRTAGSRLIPIIAASTGGGIGETLAAQGATVASRGAATAVQMRKASKVAEEIAKGISQKVVPAIAPAAGNATQIGGAIAATKLGEAMQSEPAAQIDPSAYENTAPIPPVAPPAIQEAPVAPQPVMQAPLAPQSMAKPPLMSRIAMAESGGNPKAVNPNSSASGLYQFTNKTWAAMVEKYGKQTGIRWADKNDPQAQTTMANLLVDEHREIIEKAVKRPPTDGELYAAHFFGAKDILSMLRANSNAVAARVTPSAAKSNRSIFFEGKRPRTVAEVMMILESKVS